MFKFQALGAVGYGGAVTLTKWWDDKRIADGKLAEKEVWKKASFWTYLGIGLPATLLSAFGWWKASEAWMEPLSHGFFYDFPRFIYGLVTSMRATEKKNSGSAAVAEARRILAEANKTKQLNAGRDVSRSYQPEFENAAPYAF
uniref:Uncharacterized protein n=1 Tax=viral metagenome TaxID=1070528 RepID=A0A6M3M239_9ZZZZ